MQILKKAVIVLAGAMCISVVGVAVAAGSPDSDPVVTVSAGKLAGVYDQRQKTYEFKGVPYARPPTGALRWRSPQPVEGWSGVRPAKHFGARCMQLPVFTDMVFRSNGMSEDCLYLNVWSPDLHPGKRLPVLVYFYGGGFVGGDGSEPRYDGASLARHGIVTVTVNYRLGVFGYLALPSLAKASKHHTTGNYGSLDQAAALEWVRHNIAAFGGDPNRIIIGGESAGAFSVSTLMASPLSRGLIAGAIGESGASMAQGAPRSLSGAEQLGLQCKAKTGKQTLAELRAMPARALLDTCDGKGVKGLHSMLVFGPTIDGYFLPKSPAAIFGAGKQAHVPLLAGTNSEEMSYMALLQGVAPTVANYKKVLSAQFGSLAKEAEKFFPATTIAQVKKSGTRLASAEFTALPTWLWVHLHRKTGRTPVYYYYFTRPRPRKADGGADPGKGALHAGEIEYALGNLSTNYVYAWTQKDRDISSIMSGYFANFIKTGDPNGNGLPRWPQAEDRNGGLLRQVIGVNTHTITWKGAPGYMFLLRALKTKHWSLFHVIKDLHHKA